jgi:hypothetical protein
MQQIMPPLRIHKLISLIKIRKIAQIAAGQMNKIE